MDKRGRLGRSGAVSYRLGRMQDLPQRHRVHRGTQRAGPRRSRRPPARGAGSPDDQPVASCTSAPFDGPAIRTRVSPASANHADNCALQGTQTACTRVRQHAKRVRQRRGGRQEPVLGGRFSFCRVRTKSACRAWTWGDVRTTLCVVLLCVLCVSVVIVFGNYVSPIKAMGT